MFGTNLDPLYGFEFISDNTMADRVQFKFPKSKGKRIRKKWRRRACNFKYVPKPDIYQIGRRFIAHPTIIAQLKDKLQCSAKRNPKLSDGMHGYYSGRLSPK